MSAAGYDARIVDDWPTDSVRLLVIQRRGDGRMDHLMPDGSWLTLENKLLPERPPGIVLPAAAVEVIARAVASHLGDNLPTAAEVKVLREWLATELGRVERILAPLVTTEAP